MYFFSNSLVWRVYTAFGHHSLIGLKSSIAIDYPLATRFRNIDTLWLANKTTANRRLDSPCIRVPREHSGLAKSILPKERPGLVIDRALSRYHGVLCEQKCH